MATGWGTGAVEAASALGIPTMGLRAAQRDRLRARTDYESRMAPMEEDLTRARIADLLAKPEERAFMRSLQLYQLGSTQAQLAETRRWHDLQMKKSEMQHRERMAAEEGRWRRFEEGQTKPKPGYQWNAGKTEQIPIPGGPVDVAEQKSYMDDKGKVQGLVDTLSFTKEKAEELLGHPGLPGITGVYGKFPDIPKVEGFHEGAAFDANALLNSLKTQIFTSALQKMRRDSPTGGALGNVSNLEGDKLERIMGAMERSVSLDEFKKQLNRFINQLDYSRNKLRGDFESTYAPVIRRVERRQHPGAAPSGPSGPSTSPLTPEEQQELQELRDWERKRRGG